MKLFFNTLMTATKNTNYVLLIVGIYFIYAPTSHLEQNISYIF